MDDDVFGNVAYWVYSSKRVTAEFEPIEIVPVNEIKLFSGWNLLGSTPEIVDVDFETYKGDCNFEKIYF